MVITWRSVVTIMVTHGYIPLREGKRPAHGTSGTSEYAGLWPSPLYGSGGVGEAQRVMRAMPASAVSSYQLVRFLSTVRF